MFGREDHVQWLVVDFISGLQSISASVDLFKEPHSTDDGSSIASPNAVRTVFACGK
jgi:hypothetical protein